MSLELAAQHLASRGRKGDSMLVHMAPEEVSGLQALARAAGGTLTLNPDTGLPEANFLKRMLPMIIGAGITAATGGAAAPWMVGLGMGGLETVRTGSLEKGLMAGLGAYGGAGLAGGLAGLGSTAVTPQAMSAANAAADPIASLAAAKDAATAAGAVAPTGLGAMASGAQQAVANPSALINQMGGGMGAAKYGLAALSPTLQADAPTPFDGGGPNPYEFEYDPSSQTYTRVPVGTRQRDILRPTTTMAAGGPIEDMSNQNRMDTMMANGGQMFAAGGQVNLQGTFTAGDQGGGGQFGQANANGYQAAGSGGPIQGFSSSFGQMGSGGGNGLPPGVDARAVAADPEGWKRSLSGAQEQERRMPGSTFLSSNTQGSFPGQQQALQQQMRSGGFGGYGQAMRGLGNMGGGFSGGAANPMANIGGGISGQPSQGAAMIAQMSPQQRYEMYAASNDRRLAERMQPGNMTASHDYIAPTMSRDEFEASQNAPRNSAAMFAAGGMASMAQGGPSHLGDYSDGGRLLKGPGDGVSDSIPATIANKRPARLADGEFVVPARIVSELGNGSTEAGARKLYAMMDRVQKARGKTTGKNRVAVNSRAEKLLPA